MADPKQTSPQKQGKKNPKNAEGPNMWLQMGIALAIFVVLSAGYSFVRDYMVSKPEEVSLSHIAAGINAGLVSTITVEGDTVTAKYKDESTKTSHKEAESSLTETLANYGIIPEKMAGVAIEVKDQGGVKFWLMTLSLATAQGRRYASLYLRPLDGTPRAAGRRESKGDVCRYRWST